jgi:predicted metal-dependent phosphoesterase TrpH
MGIADIHLHTIHSHDATATVRAVLKQAADLKLNVIAITDHNEIRGSLEARDLAPKYGLESITGVEVSTKDGHLLALFVEKKPPSGLSLVDTLLIIGEMGGIAIAPHPFNHLPQSLSIETVINAMAHPHANNVLQGIETHNMSTQPFNKLAQKLSIYLPLAKIGSSDSHVLQTIGTACTEFHGESAGDFKIALESHATIPIICNSNGSAMDLLNWATQITMRRFGFASDSKSEAAPIDMEPLKILNDKE